MKTHSTPQASRLRATLPVLMALSLCVTATAQAEPPQRIHTRFAAPPDGPSPPAGTASEEGVLIMVCRRGVEGMRKSQGMPRESPLLCLATQVNEDAAQLGPARFRELLDKAASSGAMFVLVVRPE